MNQTEDDLWIGLIEALGFFIKIAGDAIKEIIILELMPFINVSIKGSFYIIINIREFFFFFNLSVCCIDLPKNISYWNSLKILFCGFLCSMKYSFNNYHF